jgi:hypothetical protein
MVGVCVEFLEVGRRGCLSFLEYKMRWGIGYILRGFISRYQGKLFPKMTFGIVDLVCSTEYLSLN